MSTIADRYPELTELHHEFMRALSEDRAPKHDSAFLWYQAIEMDRDPLKPSARCRGHEQLTYLNVTAEGGKVPGQRFATGKSPKELCTALISRHAADWDGPYQINFRYNRNSEGVWSGFYSIETSAQHRDILAGRAEFDKAIAAVLKDQTPWDTQLAARRLEYGSVGEDPGPNLILRKKKGPSERLPADPALKAAFDALVEYLKSKGVKDLYYVSYTLTKPTARLYEGDNMQVSYSV